MRLAFMGTPAFSVPALEAVAAAGHEIAVVYTQPPAPRGRGHTLQPSPVHAAAARLGLSVRTPRSMKEAEEGQLFMALNLDAAVVVAYGQILTREVLGAPRLGCFNVHASLLPRWRGAAPIQRAIMAGDALTGVQVMRMSEGLDEGAVLATAVVGIGAEETAGGLTEKLAQAGALLLPPTLARIAVGNVVEAPQQPEGVTYARKIKAAEARIDWARPAAEVDRHIRGLSPHPGAWFEFATPRGPVRVKALLSQKVQGRGEPGTVLDDALLVACSEDAVRLTRLQREGRAPQSSEDFLRGVSIPAGMRLA